MRLKLLVDMNLSPDWVPALRKYGWEAVHWPTVGDPRASDKDIMEWAAAHRYVVITHDLDFGTMLALSHEAGPSVLQIRTADTLPDHLEGAVIAALINMRPTCPLEPWSWLTNAEIVRAYCRYESA